MFRRIAYTGCLLLLALPLLLPSAAFALRWQSGTTANTLVPAVDPDYIYSQLSYMVTQYQRREAGYDNNLPVTVNGHDEFAAYWAQEMMRDLQGFGAQMRRDSFPIKGWQGRPATVAAFNVEVTVPGVTHPDQIVMIGCHYDGEAISNQSAFDDGSGCAIELGVARAMAAYWRATQTYPARTLRFVIYDAEEQGLFGSFHYLNSTINGDIPNVVAMFNEEQNGIAYPLRYLGKASNPLYPFYISLAPLQNNGAYPDQSKLSPQQRAALARFRALMQQSVAPTFALFRSEGFQNLTYHTDSGQDAAQPIFTPDQVGHIALQDDPGLGSDQVPFTLAGVPAATLSGNYQPDPKYPKIPGYPFDTPVDTIQLMNTFADGSSQQSQALTLALALPGQLTAWMLSQPDIVGTTTADGMPIAAIGDIGQTTVGHAVTFDADASFDPLQSGAA
ncbi:MAG TPA: M28 family peptidase, partial [Ktedonobacteraceae bacterium]|nr:M28 family peptidase [Ktedonobacteraceae bacterium]